MRGPQHEVRTRLLGLLAEVGAVTATEAASRLGYSSGLCSFHLRQLARHGHIEGAPRSGGRARPWRLKQYTPTAEGPAGDRFGDLARGLEDESWQRWLTRRDEAPAEWRHDEAFSAVAYLTPEEMSRVAAAIQQALAPYRAREQPPWPGRTVLDRWPSSPGCSPCFPTRRTTRTRAEKPLSAHRPPPCRARPGRGTELVRARARRAVLATWSESTH